VSTSGRSRGQLVLTAAAVVAVALASVVVAYVQLGYHGDVTASRDYTHPTGNAERVLARDVHAAATGVPDDYDWNEREAAVRSVRDRLAPRLQTLREARVESGTAYSVGYNQSAADAWRREHCPHGPNRQFGSCEALHGVVVQNRAGETHVLAVAFDLRVTTPRETVETTVDETYSRHSVGGVRVPG